MIELIRRVAPYLMAGAQAEALETSLEQIEPILASATRTGKAGAKLLLGELSRRLEEPTADLREAVNALAVQSGIDKLSGARARGLVKIDNSDPGDELDLLVSCIVSAKLAESGREPEETQTSQIIATFVENWLTTSRASGAT